MWRERPSKENLMRCIFTQSRAILLSSLTILFLLNGCGQDHPKAPLGSTPGSKESATRLSKAAETRVKRKVLLANTQNQSTSRSISASAGGIIGVQEFKISIPAGALKSNASISIDCDDNLYLQADFGPDGTQFKVPATITISYANADLTGILPADLSISWFDPATQQWIDLGGMVDTKSKTVSVPVWHFTEYSLSTR
jgi:hypothetical protein